ncbi:MAG: DUF1648 domain-containing protein [Rikenellaceae bacterium]
MSNNNPKIKIPLKFYDKMIEALCIAVILAMFVYIIINYSNLPDTIPILINAQDEVDNYGNKNLVFILPAIAVFAYIALTILGKHIHKFKQLVPPVQNTKINVYSYYYIWTRHIRHLKLIAIIILVCVFSKLAEHIFN